MIYHYQKMLSPVGALHLVSNGEGLAFLQFDEAWRQLKEKIRYNETTDAIIESVKYQLREYFAGKRKSFDVPLTLKGTEFQNAVWKSLLHIPYGKTISYSAQAEILKNPKAIRAIAGANARNKICIIVPCHRVIGKSGALTGFAGGVEVKKRLLNLENSL